MNTTTIMMKPLSIDETNTILSLPHAGQSAKEISKSVGRGLATITRIHQEHCLTITKAIGGCPPELTPTNIHYAIYLITTKKADNAIYIRKALGNITHTSVSNQTVWRAVKKAGMKAVVKQKKPRLSKHHHQDCLDFTIHHKDWTLEDWFHK